MTNACETDRAGHPHGGPQQCISYQQFAAAMRAGNETELIRLGQLLHDPGPYIKRFLYGRIMKKILDNDTRQVLESIHCNNFLTLMEFIRNPELISNMRRKKKITTRQYLKLMALDSFINCLRNTLFLMIGNKLIDITTADRESFRYFRHFILRFDQRIAYNEEEAIKRRKFCLERYLEEEQHLKRMSRHDLEYATRANKFAFVHHPLRDYIAWAFMDNSEPNPPAHMEAVFPMVITITAVGDSDENMPHAPTATSTTSQTRPPQNNNNNINGEMMDGVGMNGETTADANGKVKNGRGDNYDHIEKVMEGVVYLLKKGGQGACAQFSSRFDLGGAGTKSRIKWGTSISHPTDRISKYIRHAVTSVCIIDWMCISNLVKEWANWTLDVPRGCRDGGLSEGDSYTVIPRATSITTFQSSPLRRSNNNSNNPCGEIIMTRAQLCLVKEWANSMFDALGGYVILIILRRKVRDAYTIGGAIATKDNGEGVIAICTISIFDSYEVGLEDDHINRPSIMSSGESMESTTLGAEHLHHVAAEENLVVFMGTQTCEELLLCNRSIIVHIYPCDSNTASSGIDKYVGCNVECDDDTTLLIVVHDKAPILGNDKASYIASYEISINGDATTVCTNDNNKHGVSHYGNCEDNLTWIGNCRMTQNRGESGYGENKGGDVKTYAVYIILDNVSERKFGEITNIISVEVGSIGASMLDDAMCYGYRESINEEEVILVDGERMLNFDWDGSCMYGCRPTGDNVEDMYFGGPLAILNENIDACTWGDDVVDINVINVMSSNISQSTDDYHVDSEDVTEWKILDNHVDMGMGGNTVYTGTSNTTYDTFNHSEKDTIQDTINRVDRVTGMGKQTDIGITTERSEGPTNESYDNNGDSSRPCGVMFDNDTDSDLRSDVSEKEKRHSTDGRGVLEYSRFRKIRILECGRRRARYVYVS